MICWIFGGLNVFARSLKILPGKNEKLTVYLSQIDQHLHLSKSIKQHTYMEK